MNKLDEILEGLTGSKKEMWENLLKTYDVTLDKSGGITVKAHEVLTPEVLPPVKKTATPKVATPTLRDPTSVLLPKGALLSPEQEQYAQGEALRARIPAVPGLGGLVNWMKEHPVLTAFPVAGLMTKGMQELGRVGGEQYESPIARGFRGKDDPMAPLQSFVNSMFYTPKPGKVEKTGEEGKTKEVAGKEKPPPDQPDMKKAMKELTRVDAWIQSKNWNDHWKRQKKAECVPKLQKLGVPSTVLMTWVRGKKEIEQPGAGGGEFMQKMLMAQYRQALMQQRQMAVGRQVSRRGLTNRLIADPSKAKVGESWRGRGPADPSKIKEYLLQLENAGIIPPQTIPMGMPFGMGMGGGGGGDPSIQERAKRLGISD